MSIQSETQSCDGCTPQYTCREHRREWEKVLRDKYDLPARTSVSFHARDRWNDRTPKNVIALERALAHSNSVEHVVSEFDDADDVRLYHGVSGDGTEYAMLFILKGNTVITTYPYDGHADPRVEAYINRIKEKTVYYEP